MIPNGEDGNTVKSTTNIIERCWRFAQPVTEAQFTRDMDSADRIGLPVHRWSGADREGRPFTVVWVAGRRAGQVLSAYEITGGA